jgi:hypothetical protein
MNEAQGVEALMALEAGGDRDDEEQPAEPSAEEEASEEPTDTETEETDEPEGDDGSEAEEGGEYDEGPEGDASEPEQPKGDDAERLHGNKILISRDGEKVPVGELWQARERVREYERYLPAIQQQHAQLQQREQAFVAQQQQLQPILAQTQAVLESQLPPEPDIEMLNEQSDKYDPFAYHNATALRNQKMAQLQRVAQANHQQQLALQAQRQREMQAHLQQQQALLGQKLPVLRDKEKAAEWAKGWNEVGRMAGFTEQEMAQVYDHRLFLVGDLAQDGLKWRAQQAKAQQTQTQKAAVVARKVADKPPVQAPAARVSNGVRRVDNVRTAKEKLKRNPNSMDAAIAAVMALDQ